MLKWSGQNSNKIETDKMPMTTKKSGQNANKSFDILSAYNYTTSRKINYALANDLCTIQIQTGNIGEVVNKKLQTAIIDNHKYGRNLPF